MMGFLWAVIWVLGIITAVGGVAALIYFRVTMYEAVYKRPDDPKTRP